MTGQSDTNLPAASSPVLGIDVYNGDGPINWAGLRSAGRYFAWIKATEGGDFRDASFDTNRDGAKSGNVIPGAYHFFRPKTAVQLQIDNFCGAVGSMREGELPPALDLEVPKQWMNAADALAQLAAWQEFTVQERMSKILQWLEAVEKRLGIRPVVYASPNFIDTILNNDPRLGKYLLWLANYNVDEPTIPAPWQRYLVWQYSEHGKIPEATSHELDLNRFEGNLDELKSLCFSAQARGEVVKTESRPWYGNCPFIRWLLGR